MNKKGREIKEKNKSISKEKTNDKSKNKENIQKFGKFNEHGKRLRDESLQEANSITNNINSIKNKKKKIIETEEIEKSKNSKIISNNFIFLSHKKKCPICLEFIALPAKIPNCEHEFCLNCLDQWVEKASNCPLCRCIFDQYTYTDANNKIKTKNVEEKEFIDYIYEDEEDWYDFSSDNCMICKNYNNTHLMLVCDECNFNVCHTYCTNLDKIPDGEWNCSDCIMNKYKSKIRGYKQKNIVKILNEESEEDGDS